MKTGIGKPIRLKPLAGRATPELAAMRAELEGRPASARRKAPRAIWTHDFLASGKPGKQPD